MLGKSLADDPKGAFTLGVLFSHTPQTFQAPLFWAYTFCFFNRYSGEKSRRFFLHQPVSPGEKKFSARADIRTLPVLEEGWESERVAGPPWMIMSESNTGGVSDGDFFTFCIARLFLSLYFCSFCFVPLFLQRVEKIKST